MKKSITIELTPEQRERLEIATGKVVSAVEVRLEKLEDRVTPGTQYQ
jgi:hypothetical protein